MRSLPHILGINLNLRLSELSDQDCCNVIKKGDNLLVALDLYSTSFTGEGLVGQTINLPLLEELDLSSCEDLTMEGLRQLLAKCSATLRKLDLWRTGISGEGLDSIPVLKQLEKLNLGNCWDLTNTGLLQLLAKCSSTLKELNLCRTGISGEGLDSIPDLQLEILDLSSNQNMTDTGLLQFLAKCSSTLKDLDLNKTGISGEGLDSVPVLKLEILRLESCWKLTNEGLLELLAKCSASLEELRLHGSCISGGCLADWIQRNEALGKLRRLGFNSCENVTEEDEARIRAALPQCEVL